MKKSLFVLLFAFISVLNGWSQPVIGGDISWHCEGNGQFTFEVNLIYSCSSLPGIAPLSANLYSNSPEDTISCALFKDIDISPDCMGTNGINCNTTDSIFNGYRKATYLSNPVTLSGAPGPNGWIFYYDAGQRSSMTNLTPAIQGQVIRSIMHAYSTPNGNISTSPCFDSSPSLSETPILYLATNTDQSLFTTSSSDANLDSSYISWAQPWASIDTFNGQGVIHDTGYSALNPLPGSNIHPTNQIQPLSNDGKLILNVLTQGSFASCVKISSYKEGILISEIFKDVPYFIFANQFPYGLCPVSSNEIPQINQIVSPNYNILLPNTNSTGTVTSYKMNAFAGDTIQFGLQASDFDFLPNCLPQLISFSAVGIGLTTDSTYADSSQAQIPGLSATIKSLNSNGGFISAANNKIEFYWITSEIQVDENHSVYPFYFRFWDNSCNIPGVSEILVYVNLLKPITVSTDTLLLCQGDSGRVYIAGDTSNLSWSPNIGISNTSSASPWLYPNQNTTYVATDLNSGFEQKVFVYVDTILTPQIKVTGAQLELLNGTSYDSVSWRLNQAAYPGTPLPNSFCGPLFLSGSYSAWAQNGICIKPSNTIDTNFAGNFTLNPISKGSFNDFDEDNVSYGFNFSFTGSSALTIRSMYIFTSNPSLSNDLEFRIFDVDANIILRSDSVLSINENVIEINGGFLLYPNTDYFISIYGGSGIQLQKYKANGWPVASDNGYTTVYNASRNTGNTDYPATFSDSYPYIHFKHDTNIGLEENDLKNVIQVYPNPASSSLFVNHPDDYKVYSMNGMLVVSQSVENEMDITMLQSGMYILENSNGSRVKFVVVR